METGNPVCGMEADSASAAASSEHAGKTCYFCAGRQKAFERESERYTR
jgi:YHS domain-containing protein